MKKRAKAGKTQKTSKKGIEMPDLVSVMGKFLERIESLEKKTDHVISRLVSLPAEMRPQVQSAPAHGPKPDHGPREKVLFEVVCADCYKNCKVPFRPKAGRPVYCPECFAIRKAGHVPKDLTAGIKIPNFPKPETPTPAEQKKKASPKKKKQKPAKKAKKKK